MPDHTPQERQKEYLRKKQAGIDITLSRYAEYRKNKDAGVSPPPSVEIPAVLPSTPVEPTPAPVGEVPTQDAPDSDIMEWIQQQSFRPAAQVVPGRTEADIAALDPNVGPFPEERPTGERLMKQLFPKPVSRRIGAYVAEQVPIPGQAALGGALLAAPGLSKVIGTLDAIQQAEVIPKLLASMAFDPHAGEASVGGTGERIAGLLEAQEKKPFADRLFEEGIFDPGLFLGAPARKVAQKGISEAAQQAGLGRLAAQEATERLTEPLRRLAEIGRRAEPAQPPISEGLQNLVNRGVIKQPGIRLDTPEIPSLESWVEKATQAGASEEGIAVLREAVKAQGKSEFFDGIETSATDMAASTFMKTGKFDDFVALSPSPTQRTGPRGGNISESGFTVDQEFEATQFQEVGRAGANWADPTRLIQAIDFGFFGKALQKGLMWPTRRTSLAASEWASGIHNELSTIFQTHGIKSINPVQTRRRLDAAGDVLEEIGTNELVVDDNLLVQQHSRLLEKFSPEERIQIVRTAKDIRRFYDKILDMQNAMRLKRGQTLIEKQQNYRPWVRQSNIWSKAGLSDQEAKAITDTPALPDFIHPNEAFNPRAKHRVGGLEGYEKIRNIERLTRDYVESARKDIFYTNIIQNGKAHIRGLRRKGVPIAAEAVENWIMEAYAGKLPGLSQSIRGIIPPTAIVKLPKGRQLELPVLNAAFALRRSLTRSVFPFNWSWNLFIQTSSASLTLMRYGTTSTLQGMDFLVNPAVRKAVHKNAYSAIIKRRPSGRYSMQDVGPGVGSPGDNQRSAVETVEGWANFLTNIIEDNLTGISVRAAYHDGVRKGYKGRELWEYASEGGSKTQSMYNLEDLPGVLRNREVGTVAPFMTFAFEVMNSVRELGIGVGRIGANRTHNNRLVMLAHWFGAMFAFNAMGEKFNNRQPWQLSSFVPFYATLIQGTETYGQRGAPTYVAYTADLKKGIEHLMKYGNWKALRRWGIRYHMIGGTQINRTMEGIEAVIEGEVTDVKGRRKFKVSEDEWFKAITQGPYSTSEGRDYIDKLNKQKGPIYKKTGIPTYPGFPGREER